MIKCIDKQPSAKRGSLLEFRLDGTFPRTRTADRGNPETFAIARDTQWRPTEVIRPALKFSTKYLPRNNRPGENRNGLCLDAFQKYPRYLSAINVIEHCLQ